MALPRRAPRLIMGLLISLPFILASGLLVGAPALAQGPALLAYIPAAQPDELVHSERVQLDTYTALPTSGENALVSLDQAQIVASDQQVLQLFDSPPVVLTASAIDETELGLVWRGSSSDGNTEATLSMVRDDVAGTITDG